MCPNIGPLKSIIHSAGINKFLLFFAADIGNMSNLNECIIAVIACASFILYGFNAKL